MIKSGALLCRGPLELFFVLVVWKKSCHVFPQGYMIKQTNTRTKQEFDGSGKETQAVTVKQFLIKKQNAGLLTLVRMSQALLNIARRCCHWLEKKNKTFLSSLRPLRRKNEHEGFMGRKGSFTALEVLLIKTHFCLWVFWVCALGLFHISSYFIWQMRIK